MYSTVEDVTNALAPSTDEEGTAATIPANQIADAILEADARIDSVLPQGYVVPVVSVNQGEPPAPVSVGHPLFRFLSRDIAAYLATLTYYRNKDLAEDDAIRLRFAWATVLLAEIKAGSVNLPDSATDDYDPAIVTVFNLYDGTMFTLEDFDLARIPLNMTYYEARTRGIW